MCPVRESLSPEGFGIRVLKTLRQLSAAFLLLWITGQEVAEAPQCKGADELLRTRRPGTFSAQPEGGSWILSTG